MAGELNDKQYKWLIDAVSQASGIDLQQKKELLRSRLGKRMQAIGTNNEEKYLNLLKRDPPEFHEFIDTITTNHTFFFRENKQVEYILQNTSNSKPINIWCAACSDGSEPYSLAIQFLENSCMFNILATDISHSMLNLAERGVYPIDKVKQVATPLLYKYFKRGTGKSAGYVKVKNTIKRIVTFGKFNLIQDSSPEVFDIIFCRNVMIYFNKQTILKVLRNLSGSLKNKGYIILGGAESIAGMNHGLESIKGVPSVYTKK